MLAVWLVGAVAMFMAFLAFSLSDFSRLFVAALRASAPAMWFVPAWFLLAFGSGAATAAGLLLIANATRQLALGRPPRYALPEVESPARARARTQLFRYLSPSRYVLSAETFPVMAGAVAAELTLWAVWSEHLLAAAALTAAGAGVWTLCFIARGAYQPKQVRPVYALLSVLLVFLVTASATTAQMGYLEGEAERKESYKKKKEQAARIQAMPIFTAPRSIAGEGSDKIEGLVLRPKKKGAAGRELIQSAADAAAPDASLFTLPVLHPLSFPFTGEYYLFPAVWKTPPAGSWIAYGTPFEDLYATVTGSELAMHAYQALVPPVNFSGGGSVRLTIARGDGTLGAASAQLVLKGGPVDLGAEFIGMSFGKGGAKDQIVEYHVPASQAFLRVDAIRIVFSRLEKRNQSMRIAIREFTLLPDRAL